ncbi:MAG: SUMF1/EgtB/PvdO family nonheme iron enzyme, partial [Thiohalomonadales bacterium]
MLENSNFCQRNFCQRNFIQRNNGVLKGIPLSRFAWFVCLPLFFAGCKNQTDAEKPPAKTLAPLTKVSMVKVPAGKFIRGSDKTDTEGIQQRFGFPNTLYLDERPMRSIHLDAFEIDLYEVTNKLYKEYIQRSSQMMPFDWLSNGYALDKKQLQSMTVERLRAIAADFAKLDIDSSKMDKPALIAALIKNQAVLDNYPVGSVSWFDAQAYCQWRSARLPTEMEWEKAARGEKGLEFPWGNNWDPKITNTGDDGEWEDGVAPVGQYPDNKSPYGAYDMSGNVWEWVADWYDVYADSDYRSPLFGQSNRVVRGGGGGVGHYAIRYFFRTTTRQYSEPQMESPDVGF